MLCNTRKPSTPSWIEHRARRGSETRRTKGGVNNDLTGRQEPRAGKPKSQDKQSILLHASLSDSFSLDRPASGVDPLAPSKKVMLARSRSDRSPFFSLPPPCTESWPMNQINCQSRLKQWGVISEPVLEFPGHSRKCIC